MGEARRGALWVGFDRAIKLDFHGAKVSSDASLFAYRDLDEAAQRPKGGSNPPTPPDEEVDPRHGQFGQARHFHRLICAVH